METLMPPEGIFSLIWKGDAVATYFAYLIIGWGLYLCFFGK